MKTTPLLNHSIFASDEHLFYNCEIKRSFWVALCSWLMECNINLEPLSAVNVLFGIFNAGENLIVIVNHLILVVKFYTYHRKLKFTAINVINVINVIIVHEQ